ncbi:MAG: hypothetical protein AAGG08_10075 [Actinomycetota bacterium]
MTDPDVFDDDRRDAFVRALTTAGWFAFVAWVLFIFRQVGRVTQINEPGFGGVWEERIEVLSFVVLPPNAVVIVPAAALAILATWLSGARQTFDLAVLLRLVRWGAVLQGVIAIVSAVTIVFTETGSPTEAQDVALRTSGLAMAAGVVVVALATERTSPAWEERIPPPPDDG